ncbi:DNA-binding transcriptional regulator YhcF (GntR family) [Haloactinopolyspora alba]|uniref:DNA-binding transcriptional regulator YhcF (GntR family) n=1 Tax=Haloactinopolyspora alba TaxID=648780 RepID=A0A2P8D5D5_9ACTN|nr:GntR family transcriptional regulator [Haloactinopolyspora alba]PSK92421.1 DNA-binding transcriptional regulator YhcF (GntR family) [Haloactinopolyspora alba]
MLFRLDPNSAEPLFAQIAAAVRGAVARGDVQPGERLPGARDLADSLGLNVHTVLRGYQQLRDEGLVELRRGRGAVVVRGAVGDWAELRQEVADVVERARGLGVSAQELFDMIRLEYR